MAGLSERVADFISAAALDDISGAARRRARRAIVDSVGVMVSGAASEVAEPLLKYLDGAGGTGDVPVLGTGRRAGPERAALVNGAFGHALDYDDGFPIYPVHASTGSLAALFSGLGPGPVRGRDLLQAYIVGIEVVTAVGRGLGIGHYNRGFHATGTLGVFAGLAALAKLKGLDTGTIRRALGIGASLASGIQRNFGTMTKPLHMGWAARNALVAANLAQCGFDGHVDVFDGADGFFAAFGGDGASTAKAAQLLGSPFIFEEYGLGMKSYPCVNTCQRPIAGMAELRGRHGLTPDNVESILVLIPPGSDRPLKYSRPKTGLEGKFSMEYAVAAALVDPRVGLASFTDAAVARPEIQALLPKVSMKAEPRCSSEDPLADVRGPGTRGFMEVHVTTAAGDTHQIRVDRTPGGLEREMSEDEMLAKFLDCTSFAGIVEARARDAFGSLMDLEEAGDVAAIIAGLN